MYRKITIKDVSGKKIEMEVHPEQNNLIKVNAHEINLTFGTRKALTSFISATNAFMSGNTINKVEVEEV
ncbi:hypothetical protein LCGC14_0712580 [marine sediment metagenome]|uniref:Uncharacterized protein n=1 Tax=marine sediment metagenome TaxID=412755 RepID=A0A0F9R005_9ZZZZ